MEQPCSACGRAAGSCGWCRGLPGYTHEMRDGVRIAIDPRGQPRDYAQDCQRRDEAIERFESAHGIVRKSIDE